MGFVKKANNIFVHHTNSSYLTAAEEADSLLGVKRTELVNVRCRAGELKLIESEKGLKTENLVQVN